MLTLEKKLASRIIRNAKPMEDRLFRLVDQLQCAINSRESVDWDAIKRELVAIQNGAWIAIDLIGNLQRELNAIGNARQL